MQIIKRDGTFEKFDSDKIINAVLPAFKEVDGELGEYAIEKASNIAKYIKEQAEARERNYRLYQKGDRYFQVEEIQDLVENGLASTKRKDVAFAFHDYRAQKTRERNMRSGTRKAMMKALFPTESKGQNANVDEFSHGGRMGEAMNEAMTEIAFDCVMSKRAVYNHINNRIYTHDRNAYAVGMHNCCARETKFCTTNDGVKTFLDYEDGDTVNVLTPYGTHEIATVHRYGIQKLNKITFSLAGQRFITERFTSNHRWLLKDGTETTNLKIGDKLMKPPVSIRTNEFSFDDATDKEKYYWCLGFVLADGTEAYRWSHGKKNEDIKFVRMRLCGDKIKYEPRFSNLKHSTKEMDNGDLYLTFSSVIGFRKQFPNIEEMTRKEKHALFDGLYAADGQKAGSRKSILTTDEQIASFIEDEAPALGWFILNIKDKTGEQTNYKKRGFTKEYTFIGDSNKYFWTVTDIQEDAEEEVWCLDVNNSHAFVLPSGITTGNCLSIPIDDLAKNGAIVRGSKILRPCRSFSSFGQLSAVWMQLQSLEQFGGVSYTHYDWSGVPYVRISFNKYFVQGLRFFYDDFEDSWIPVMTIDEIKELSIDSEEYKYYAKAYIYAMEMLENEVHQTIEALYHNLNTLQSRSGNQLPFSSINYGTCTLPEGRMITRALLECSIDGIGEMHTTPIFPCGIFQLMAGVNRKPGDPNYDLFKLALESTSKRLYPNYANVDWSGNAGYDKRDPRTYFSTMGKCKL